MNFARQRDANEAEIISALRKAGAAVQQLGEAGVPDLLVSYRGELHLLEVKNPHAKGGGKYNTGDGSLTATQTKWWRKWMEAHGRPPIIVYSAQAALLAIGAPPSAENQNARGGAVKQDEGFTP